MELLVAMIRNLVIIIIVATLLELVMPPGRLKPLVQMTIGFFVIITILNPVLALLFHKEKLGINGFILPEEVNRQLNQALITGQDVNHQLQRGMQEEMKSRIQGQIRSLALLAPGVAEIEPVVRLDARGDIKEVHLVVKKGAKERDKADIEEKIPAFLGSHISAEDPELESKLKDWISSYYQVSPEHIRISWH